MNVIIIIEEIDKGLIVCVIVYGFYMVFEIVECCLKVLIVIKCYFYVVFV